MTLPSSTGISNLRLRQPGIEQVLNYFCPVHILIISAFALVMQAPLRLFYFAQLRYEFAKRKID